MLFNSYSFIFGFLPITIFTYFVLHRILGYQWAKLWLVIASLAFYAYFNIEYLWIIASSIVFNYVLGQVISTANANGVSRQSVARNPSKFWLIFGISINLALLGYFKYSYFFVSNLSLIGYSFDWPHIVLPIGISFFTFQQIAYLVDTYSGNAREADPIDYALFVTFFPQLIAGPIVHHKEMMPQFARAREIFGINYSDIAIGLTIFAIGLAKKIVFADSVANYANPVFAAAELGQTITMFEAWLATSAYTLQLYFDFSGYSDMAIGLARLFGIRLPINFFSPYKARDIVDFWRRWHITLSRFLRDYLYIPLGGNRKGQSRRYINLFATMLLGGMWHGAGWTFVIWGGLHGFYISLNHIWVWLRRDGNSLAWIRSLPKVVSIPLTLLSVMCAWVFFRSESVTSALDLMHVMFFGNGFTVPSDISSYMGQFANTASTLGVTFSGENIIPLRDMPHAVVLIIGLFIIALLGPNTAEIMRAYRPTIDYREYVRLKIHDRILWRPTPSWAFLTAITMFMALILLSRANEFLYFQF